eukprot:7389265-Prymnesium_polylepis.1
MSSEDEGWEAEDTVPERLVFRGRSFKDTSSGAPTPAPDVALPPQPPQQPAPPPAREASGQYAARLSRARAANRATVLTRSASMERMEVSGDGGEAHEDRAAAPAQDDDEFDEAGE